MPRLRCWSGNVDMRAFTDDEREYLRLNRVGRERELAFDWEGAVVAYAKACDMEGALPLEDKPDEARAFAWVAGIRSSASDALHCDDMARGLFDEATLREQWRRFSSRLRVIELRRIRKPDAKKDPIVAAMRRMQREFPMCAGWKIPGKVA